MKKLKTINAPSVILRLEELKRTTRITLANLAHLEKLNTTPTIGLLAKMSCVSDRTINRELAELEEKGYITRDTKYLNGKGRQTTISIVWNKIESQTEDYDWYEDKQQTSNIENKPVLSPQNDLDDNLYQPTEESGSKGLKSALNDKLETNAIIEKTNNDIYMGNLTNITINPNTGRAEYTTEQKEEIKQRVIDKNTSKPIPNVKVETTSVYGFDKWLDGYKHIVTDIINAYNSGDKARIHFSGKVALGELLNRKDAAPYKEQIKDYINNHINKSSIIEQPKTVVEQVQELINNDDNFYKVFTNCIKVLSSDEPQESATNKLISLLNEYNVPYNTQVRDFIADEIYCHINNKAAEYAA